LVIDSGQELGQVVAYEFSVQGFGRLLVGSLEGEQGCSTSSKDSKSLGVSAFSLEDGEVDLDLKPSLASDFPVFQVVDGLRIGSQPVG
jgi:hypothetical protein